MKRETYRKMTQPFRDNPKRAGVLHIVNKILTAIVFAAYPCLLAVLFFQRDRRLVEAICLPLDGLMVVSVVRVLVNRPRPYEKFGIPSVIPKETKGKSWPSRHVFSAAVIALTFFPFSVEIGTVLLIAAVGLAVIRVLSGVHYISDVLSGFVFAMFFALYFVIH